MAKTSNPIDAENKYFYGVGRRKSATARAKFYQGTKELQVLVNKKPIAEYFESYFAKTILNAIANIGILTGDIHFFINGGGISGQAEAARLAISKAVLKSDESYRTILRMHGYLTTDIRKVLSKKTGLRKARKREQWSKR
jgi:small subunit ribosomal protein S9